MRLDIRQGVTQYMEQDIKPNYAAIARLYDTDYRTVKRALHEVQVTGKPPEKPAKRVSLLAPYYTIIDEKLELHCSAMAIFKFIKKKGFKDQ